MPPTLKKLKEDIVLGLSMLRPSVSASLKKTVKIWFPNFINGFLIKK